MIILASHTKYSYFQKIFQLFFISKLLNYILYVRYGVKYVRTFTFPEQNYCIIISQQLCIAWHIHHLSSATFCNSRTLLSSLHVELQPIVIYNHSFLPSQSISKISCHRKSGLSWGKNVSYGVEGYYVQRPHRKLPPKPNFQLSACQQIRCLHTG